MKLQFQSFAAVPPRTLARAGEIALAATLAVVAAQLTWRLATPVGPFEPAGQMAAAAPAPQADLSILAQFDPFFRGASSVATAAESPSGGGLTLFGVRVSGEGKGSAILGSADGQRSVQVGQEVQPGVVLAAVAPDHVILRRGGGRQRLGFPQPTGGGALMPVASSTVPAGADSGPAIDLDRLLAQASLTPRLRDGQPAGYQIVPRGGGDALRAAGLQRGDVLLSVDGVTLTPERVSQLREELANSTGAELRFERGGQIMTTRLRTAPQ
ncbi:general secretion pathway protein [Phenylobacterium sp. J426]|uniref:type II secretion system protein N n=1 Tax=Phenylobacterium sp. J426 TaxID=2898439 RepID=UPI002151D1BD|nr:type II secretion system protein N [Phenylobacterium sp. J426]MCR5874052.1 general secretion pathway protein [Phenylobacterium sp. J426]